MRMLCPRCQARYKGPADCCPLDGAALVELPDPLLGRVLADRYRVEECVGRGGIGAVYRARHVQLGREVALKVLDEAFTSDPVQVQRFVREARAVNLTRHPNIVDIYDVGQSGATVFLVMDLLRGETLARRIARGPIEPREAAERLIPITEALAHAHSLGVIHRDIKPENIFLCAEGGRVTPRVLDFGIAYVHQEVQLTATGQVLGTPVYMCPERIKGQACMAASDLYSLGVTAFEMLSGAVPFDGTSAVVTVRHVREAPPDLGDLAPRVPPALAALVMNLLAKEPFARPSSARVLNVLRQTLTEA